MVDHLAGAARTRRHSLVRAIGIVSTLAFGIMHWNAVRAAPPAGEGVEPAIGLVHQRLRKLCDVEPFLVCMRWDAPKCRTTIDNAIEAGTRLARPQAEKLAPRHRNNPEVVRAMYSGGILGSLLVASGPRLNNCMPDARGLR